MATPSLLALSLFSPVLPQTPPPVGVGAPSSSLNQHSDRSPPPTPTPRSPRSPTNTLTGTAALLMLSTAGIRAISPPTPAPSPQPYETSRFLSQLEWSPPSSSHRTLPISIDEYTIENIRAQFALMPPSMRQRLLTSLIADSSPSILSPLLPLIAPRLQRDFFKTLPIELAFHVLSFVDDVRTLARASGVSRFWRALLEDEGTWRRMCWKKGFGDSEGDDHEGSGNRIRSLEFGEREEEEGTPAGRERRGTLDREGLVEFAARAELFGLRSATIDEGAESGWPRRGSAAAATSSWTRRDEPTETTQWDWSQGGLGLGSAFASTSSFNATASTSTPRPPLETLGRSPALISIHSQQSPTSTFNVTSPTPLLDTQSPRRHSLPLLSDALVLAQPPLPIRSSSTSPGPPPLLSTPPSENSSSRKPFSYKTHFKRAYLTESAWLRGPGRLLSTQMSADDGVVTSLGFDSEWIVVGMATSKVHIFEAASGGYVKTLDGHELGVWCLTLVSKGGGNDKDKAKGKARGGGGGDDSLDLPFPPSSHEGKGSNPTTPRRAGTANGDRSFTNDSPTSRSSFFRHARGPVSNQDPVSPSASTNAPTSPPSRPRRSSLGGPPSPPAGIRIGGMGLGAGGETGDSSQQAGVCGTARGWGQEGAVVVSGGCDRDVRVWDVESGQCLHVLRGHTSTVRCMRVIDGRPIAVSGSRDGTLRVWNIETGTSIHLLAGHQHSVRCIEVSGNKVVSGSYDATCRLWDVDTGQCLFVFRGHDHQIYAVAFDGIRVVTGSLDSTVRIWSATTGEFLVLLQGHTSLVGQLQLDPVSNVLVTGGSDGRVIVYNLTTFETQHRLCAHDNSVTCLQFDDRFIVTGGNDGRIKLWDFKTGSFIRELADPCDAVWRVTFRDDKCVILCRRDGKTLMDVRTFRPSELELHGDN